MMTVGPKVFLTGLALAILASLPNLVAHRSLQGLRSEALQPGLLLVGMLVALAGIFIYALQPAFQTTPRDRGSGSNIWTALALVIVVAVLANLLSLLYLLLRPSERSAIGAGQPLGASGLLVAAAATEISILLVVWLRLIRPGYLSWRSFGLNLDHFEQRIRAGLLGGLLLFAASAVTAALISAAGIRQNQFEEFRSVTSASPGLFILILVAGCVLAPMAEEIFFRGYLFQTFSQKHGPLVGYLISATLFAVVHGNLAAAVPIFVLGLLLAAIFQRTGSLLPGIIAHGVNNAVAFALLYAGFKG